MVSNNIHIIKFLKIGSLEF